MATKLSADRLIAAAQDDSLEAGITIRADLEPLGGDGTPVKPATYEGGQFQHGRRWVGGGDERRAVDILVIDNEPSQANRLEAALRAERDALGLPDIVLDLSSAGQLPPHLPREISIYQFPHRNSDAYLRDSMLDGVPFTRSELGKAIFAATAAEADALLAWCPQAPLFGFWQSHLGKKRSQAKKARSWTSEIIGIEPAADDIRRMGLKGDPLNLSIAEAVSFNENVLDEWGLTDKGKRLADIGHGQVPVGGEGAALAGVSFRDIVQQATVSFASLRTVRTSKGAPQARAVLAALGLVAHVAAFGKAFNLRSGADLRPRQVTWRWLGAHEDDELEVPELDAMAAVFSECVEKAEAAGAPVGARWRENRLTVSPSPSLLDVIRKSWPAD
ncbi:MAG: type I-U CRISPR-associated RAMP protein Csb1/Cas7u [Actinomycetota bacterium]|jgi:CRISPR-associated protein Csb1|nr:type I-U CRISPR-associated RAMP protein Csb1/Cas7u [Actinomycetota bacterium]